MAFFDTNVLVYMYDRRETHKQATAAELFHRHFPRKLGAISTQVLQEFFVAATRKTGLLTASEAAKEVAVYAAMDTLVVVQPYHVLDAIQLHLRMRIAFWDGLIVAAARAAGASILFTEDLSHGRVYDGVRAENPFLVP